MKLPITMYRDEDGWYVVECPVIPGCMSQGRTEVQAMENMREAVQLCLEVRQEQRLPLVLESRAVEIPR
jgi:predicted RNase H-like HicB family nuclease